MAGMLAKLGFAALVTFATTVGTVSTAAADSNFGWGVYVGGGPGYDRHYRDDYRPGWGHEPRRHRPQGCSPRRAVEEARWSGLRRARVHNVTPRRVVVAGFRHGEFDRMVFANVRGCPIIRY
ncbi:hypothetical protein [Ciceribacter selenitireducens]|jgi:hypothetical protein|uniref:Antifreeze protein n=1 Tax=Ciceribacter selenitireducens ATCC BAA-1503 TaxID=1336235 RepID=A0A376A9Q1_9HYPH|nr:hypothetical protein [Ciceribacter selenitireducens]SSC64525.1 unnamed protein product [Ciceribacter selenitireducens ATCC BAA-1503]